MNINENFKGLVMFVKKVVKFAVNINEVVIFFFLGCVY